MYLNLKAYMTEVDCYRCTWIYMNLMVAISQKATKSYTKNKEKSIQTKHQTKPANQKEKDQGEKKGTENYKKKPTKKQLK